MKVGTSRGFTIVELLIVIVVIGILAAITVVAFNGVQQRAQEAKIKSDVSAIVKAVQAAQTTRNQTLFAILSNSATGSPCWSQADGTDLAQLDKVNHGCWTTYNAALTAIGQASGANLTGLVDPWGRPYLIDANEGEGGNCNLRDTIAVYKRPFTTAFGTYSSTPANNVPASGAC